MTIYFKNCVPIPLATQVEKSDIWLTQCELEAKHSYQIVAPSGTGKSSLIHILYGMRSDFQGEVFLDNCNTNTYKDSDWANLRRNHISIVFQGLQLFPELTALENIELKNKLTNHKTRHEISELFELFKLGAKQNQSVATLSFGQQQRVAAIRALCQPFNVLLLDEPYSHLDKRNAAIVAERMSYEAQQQGATVITTLLHAHGEIPHDSVLYL
jgi:ABC-type lipoprotein export system ATPase subunit